MNLLESLWVGLRKSLRSYKGKFQSIIPMSLLKDSLFHGMHQHLKDSLHYLYTQDSVTYAQLLQAACAAEFEVEKG